jgi:hypothetical protein
MENPFAVKSPESLSDKQISELFVDVFTDFSKIKDSGHTFIHGARGTGKSMMLRFLEPSVQLIAGKVRCISDLNFFAIHIPIRTANLSIPQLERLMDSAYSSLAEHLLLMHIATRVFSDVSDLAAIDDLNSTESTELFALFTQLMEASGGTVTETQDVAPLKQIVAACESEFRATIQYLKRLTFTKDPVAYNGALCGYIDFLIPLISKLKDLSFTPRGPVFLMLDDADNLPEGMQKIINTWVAMRTGPTVSLKVSTQLRYKTTRTLDGTLIESPHDYSEINIGTIYTSRKEHYFERVSEIVKRRLDIHYPGMNLTPIEFFPVDEKQEREIEIVRQRLRENWEKGEGVGNRASDDVTRYAVPEYMASLAGSSKSSSTFSYAGFRNMVDISGGVVRAFLEPAALMYSEAEALGRFTVERPQIPAAIQDKILKEWSEELVLNEFDKLNREARTSGDSERHETAVKLLNLVNGLGSLFRAALLSRGSERKFFSFTLSGRPSEKLDRVLSLGVEWGYLQRSTIGTKEGLGRNTQYVLNRRLAPYYKLDPSSYAAYLQVTPEDLEVACDDPKRFARSRLEKKLKGKEQSAMQMTLPLGHE